MKTRTWLYGALLLASGALAYWVTGCAPSSEEVKLLNVSYDPTRELYEEVKTAFAKSWKEQSGEAVAVKTMHDGSGKQARKVIEGFEADVVTLALAYDIDAIRQKAGLLAKDWQSRLPHNSCPYTSTIIFLVRRGNPKHIQDWGDLLKPDVQVVTPNPKTSGGARWNYLAAWGYVLKRELGSFDKLKDPQAAEEVARANEKARDFLKQLFDPKKTPVLDTGARSATITFKNGIGDVFLAWENEAYLVLQESGKGKYEIVVPSISILAEPPVAVVDKVVDKHGTRKEAEAFLKFLYTPEGQTMAARHFYRPCDPKGVPEELLKQFRPVEMFRIDEVFGGWAKAQKEHFDDGGIYDQIKGT
ncbi:MAG: sulfate ABC transporter substrate-binding protein [Pirellulales bacterium]|nr:sulfate ABC transporter substrate-binding protein [Pirellulales bacterium]